MFTNEFIDTLADKISERINKNFIDSRAVKDKPIPGNGERFGKLRKRIHANGMTHEYLAEKLRISTATLSRRMTDKSPWLLSEIYVLIELLQIPNDRMHEYFPKNGK